MTQQDGLPEREEVSLCSLRAGEASFGIDTRQIREVLGKTTPQAVPMVPEFIAGMVPYRGEVLITVSLRALLGLDAGDGTGCVLVLEDDEDAERFGLMVDAVGRVMTMPGGGLEENPSTLDARSMALFEGSYRTDSGLLVRLGSRGLRPVRLLETGLFHGAPEESTGEERRGGRA